VSRAGTRRQLRARAQELLDPAAPGRHNEAMMELGATVCLPRNPRCTECPIAAGCAGLAGGNPEIYPVKAKRKAVPEYRIAIGVVVDPDGRFLIQRRPQDGMLGGLWEFPGGKCRDEENPEEACVREIREELGIEVAPLDKLGVIRHAYSHFKIVMHAYRCAWVSGSPVSALGEPFLWIQPEELDSYAFPRANRRLIEMLSN
jgi:A/G-specific adenine glycosylase